MSKEELLKLIDSINIEEIDSITINYYIGKELANEAIKSTEKINKLKDKLTGDKMEQFDDYIIYLIESYLEILEE